ncbi:hypothetical protein PTKIN_Ptkin05aG0214200 [Pterospermum kingtungense]
MAAANGHIEVVRELMEVDSKLCCPEGRGNKTPLHIAAMQGRVDVISEMLLSCAVCIEDTIVILNNKKMFYVCVRVCVFRVIELVLTSKTTPSASFEVNAVNQSGLTALDVLQILPSEAGDREIAEILQHAGAVSTRDVMISPVPSHESHNEVNNNSITQQRCQRKTDDLLEYFKFKKERDSPGEAHSALLVIAVLVATATFQVGLSPPAGIGKMVILRTRKMAPPASLEHTQQGTPSWVPAMGLLLHYLWFSIP